MIFRSIPEFGALILMFASLSACSIFSSISPVPSREPLPPAANDYLGKGPATDVELGAGERTLLEDYKRLDDTRIQLETRLAEAQAEIASVRTQLAQTQGERDRERQARVGAEQEIDRLAGRTRDLEAKILSLSIRSSRLEQETLRARISEIELHLAQMSPGTAPPSAPAPQGKH